ncbi:MAG TPA: TonB family protein [Candidatus Sulfotelmatobacter sp.]|nr:TonB family protein [Candidatus Sulfotelmatobacter sp.]
MSKAETWRAWEGRVVDGKYPLRQWLGGSDHSAVFLTEMPGGAKAAIKFIEADGPDAEREFGRLGMAAKLSHPHLISIFNFGRCRMDGTALVYAVMEHADEDLAQILPQRPLTPAEVSDMLTPLLDGLGYLHGNGFVHTRIKPSNVLVVADQLKLSTDQIGRTGEPISARRRIGVYDAPETSSGAVLPASDVWSLGVTIVMALTQNAASAAQAMQGDPSLPGNIAEPFRGIARECLHIDPAQRCTLEDIRRRLQPAAAAPIAAPLERSHKSESDSSRLPAFAIPLVLVVVALAAWGLFRSHGNSAATPRAETTAQPAAEAPPPKPTAATPDRDAPNRPAPVHTERTPTPRATSAGGGAVVHQVIPDIPASAKRTIHGTIKVVVWVDVDPSGKVMAAKLKTAGPSRYFAGKALSAAERWEFSPPQADGQPTTSAWLLQFRFKRSGVQASPQRAHR